MTRRTLGVIAGRDVSTKTDILKRDRLGTRHQHPTTNLARTVLDGQPDDPNGAVVRIDREDSRLGIAIETNAR